MFFKFFIFSYMYCVLQHALCQWRGRLPLAITNSPGLVRAWACKLTGHNPVSCSGRVEVLTRPLITAGAGRDRPTVRYSTGGGVWGTLKAYNSAGRRPSCPRTFCPPQIANWFQFLWETADALIPAKIKSNNFTYEVTYQQIQLKNVCNTLSK